MMRISVCALTYCRPRGLERLLQGLGKLRFAAGSTPDLQIVIVDNDPEGSAAELCEELRPELRWPLRYEHETRRGISFARNRAVDAALESGADFLAFIDDDEVPEPGWLAELLRVQAAYDADIVVGPKLPRFEGETPAWVVRGNFFAPKVLPTGHRLEHAATSNMLIRAETLRTLYPPFDPRLALSGGEDTLFCLRAAGAGRSMVWANDARVYEWIPASRARADWVLRRAYREGTTWSWCERELQPTGRVIAMRVAKGLAKIARGALMLPLALPRRGHVLVRAVHWMCVGAGNLAGLLGVRYEEYRTTHGS